MTVIDIISGFLGAGKTTLIKKLIKESFQGQKLVLIENEFGDIGIDGGFMKEAGIQVTEMNSGCICCSLVGDFGQALKEVITTYAPDRIMIEPSGVGKLSDVAKAVGRVAETSELRLGSAITVVNAKKCKMYMKNFGEFFDDQVKNAGTIILSRTADMKQDKLEEAIALLRAQNQQAVIITTDWDQLTGDQILSAMARHSMEEELLAEVRHHHHHHHHDHGEDCCCGGHGHHHEDGEHECRHGHGHHHEDGEHECCHGHGHHHEDGEHECRHGHGHHHEDGEHECCHGHGHHHEHHHHDHGEHCTCGCHDHDHHHHHDHHHADEVFTSWGMESARKYTGAEIAAILTALDSGQYGQVLRAKGIVPNADGSWIHFDFVPGEQDIRSGAADVTGRFCVIGAQLKEEELKALFRL
ncbi:MAG: GTP-binding protein [Oscillospiraceae bacterium]|nr:GTP-binding protein [Oscillospiraceae bacterium]